MADVEIPKTDENYNGGSRRGGRYRFENGKVTRVSGQDAPAPEAVPAESNEPENETTEE